MGNWSFEKFLKYHLGLHQQVKDLKTNYCSDMQVVYLGERTIIQIILSGKKSSSNKWNYLLVCSFIFLVKCFLSKQLNHVDTCYLSSYYHIFKLCGSSSLSSYTRDGVSSTQETGFEKNIEYRSLPWYTLERRSSISWTVLHEGRYYTLGLGLFGNMDRECYFHLEGSELQTQGSSTQQIVLSEIRIEPLF